MSHDSPTPKSRHTHVMQLLIGDPITFQLPQTMMSQMDPARTTITVQAASPGPLLEPAVNRHERRAKAARRRREARRR